MSAVLKDPDATQPMELVSVIKSILNPHCSPRKNDQLAIEQAIMDFKPDFTEAQELVDALTAALGRRYRSDFLMVVEEEARALKIAMHEAEPYEPDPADDYLWREGHPTCEEPK